MKKCLILFLLTTMFSHSLPFGEGWGGAYAQSPSWLWAKSAGGSGDDKAYSIATDNTGNVYVTGVYYSPSIIFGADTFNNPGSMFLVKYDANGNIIWAKTSAGSNYNYANSVATDNTGNVYVAGYFSSNNISFDSITLTRNDTTVIWSNLFLVKYNSSGNVIWAKNATKGSSTASAVIADNFGNIFVAGNAGIDTLVIGPDTLFPNSFYDRFVAKYDTAGNPLWARGLRTGGTTTDVSEPFIASDKYGNVYATGGFHTNSCVIVSTVLVNQGDHDIYLAKFNPSGNLLWAKQYGYSGYETSTSVAADTIGNIYITGFFTSTIMYFDTFMMHGYGYTPYIVKLDAGGTALWAKQFGRLDDLASLKIVSHNNQDVFISGYFSSSALVFTATDSLVNQGLFLAKYDSNGNFKWARDAVGGSRATAVTVDATGKPYITGYFGDSLGFDATLLLGGSTSSSNIFVAAIDILSSVQEYYNGYKNVLSIFPNPSNGKFHIVTNQQTPCRIFIYDLFGKEIINEMVGTGLQPIDLSNQSKGIYFIKALVGNKVYSNKIVIQ